MTEIRRYPVALAAADDAMRAAQAALPCHDQAAFSPLQRRAEEIAARPGPLVDIDPGDECEPMLDALCGPHGRPMPPREYAGDEVSDWPPRWRRVSDAPRSAEEIYD